MRRADGNAPPVWRVPGAAKDSAHRSSPAVAQGFASKRGKLEDDTPRRSLSPTANRIATGYLGGSMATIFPWAGGAMRSIRLRSGSRRIPSQGSIAWRFGQSAFDGQKSASLTVKSVVGRFEDTCGKRSAARDHAHCIYRRRGARGFSHPWLSRPPHEMERAAGEHPFLRAILGLWACEAADAPQAEVERALAASTTFSPGMDGRGRRFGPPQRPG